MQLHEYARTILLSPSLEDKLIDPSIVEDIDGIEQSYSKLDIYPGRNKSIQFSDKQIKFPRKNSFHLDEKKGLALHFFANHELLAVEMMAAALLYLPVSKEESKRLATGLLSTIRDEQKHFKMYRSRMNDFGIDFGDFPLNDYFWRQMVELKTLDEYFAVMALTFEAANLDFAKYYGQVFESFEDTKTAKLMNIVYEDEISHVALGVRWLKVWKKDKSLWKYYLECLPDLLTPARSKGISFDRESRIKSGMDENFIKEIENYRDDFKITQRKEW